MPQAQTTGRVTMKTHLRRNDLDWLRVLAILAVFVFHSGRFFDLGGWHVKNPTTYFGMQVWITFLANWLMPVVFVISGASLFFALGSRGTWKFVYPGDLGGPRTRQFYRDWH
jgi:peptidoglycan/LPS O-acetylase OafA/YrhL